MLHGIPKRKFVSHKIPKKEIFILAENEIYVIQVYKKGGRLKRKQIT